MTRAMMSLVVHQVAGIDGVVEACFGLIGSYHLNGPALTVDDMLDLGM